MHRLIEIILSDDESIRNQSLEAVCEGLSLESLLLAAAELDQFRRQEKNLYFRVRALFFLAAIHRYHLPNRLTPDHQGLIPFDGYGHLLSRRFLEAIDVFLQTQATSGPSDGICSALAEAYHKLGFQTLADQVRASVRGVRGNQWMFRIGHPDDHPLRIRPELLDIDPETGASPLIRECTAVRMDFSHSAWSDIFFLGMDYPQGARVVNVSVDLGVRGRDPHPVPPIETFLRIIDVPVIRLTSVDLGVSAEVESITEMFDFARDYLGLLKAAVIAAGIVPPGLEGSDAKISDLLSRLVGPGRGIELVSKINDIPKGSRLAVSTNLLGSLISILMRATGQVQSLQGTLTEADRRIVAARAILGEWIGGSGGGWQDSGGVWPGIKLICGTQATEKDPEFGISRGRLMPVHHVLTDDELAKESTRERIQDSLVLVHGGMAQNVGPILEMVTEHYLLRSDKEWAARQEAMEIYDEVVAAIRTGDVRRIGELTTRNFEGPLRAIIPWSTNRFTDRLIEICRDQYGDQFWGFWMLGGMAGGGMGFIFDPKVKEEAADWLSEKMVEVKRSLDTALPFAMDPVVYDFSINDNGSFAVLLTGENAIMPDRYYALVMPELLRTPLRELPPGRRSEMAQVASRIEGNQGSDTAKMLVRGLLPSVESSQAKQETLPEILDQCGFDRQQHETIREDLLKGRIGLASNRLASSTTITDVRPQDVIDLRGKIDQKHVVLGSRAIADGQVAVITLAAGVGSRWTEGAGVCKALHPFNRFAGRHRSFLEVHLAKNRRIAQQHDCVIPHVFTTSYLTDGPIREYLACNDDFGMPQVHLSTGRSIGLRMIPTERDLRFLWEETTQQVLDAQQQKVRESVRAALIGWARNSGQASDYTNNLPRQCVHPVGHWYEVPNLLRNGLLHKVLTQQSDLKYLLLHNIDTLGATVDPGLLGHHIDGGAALSFEVITRRLEDRGGGLALVGGRPRLVEGLAMPTEDTEFNLTYYNSMTTWIDIDALLTSMGLTRSQLDDSAKVDQAVRQMANRMPTYVTLKDVKKRWGHAQEDVFPVSQFEKLWGDMTSLPEIDCQFFVTPMQRGQQLKTQSQLDPWKRDGTADYIDSLCQWD
ncbi:UTP--glucose-1-phosphate uridylyltransferase [Rubripirellula obstinata]|uniref:UTP--glucose-1-phosphate uridylyltransferase n=1 Tax=Rubripirellula obstinata TaxID=406547 RepID=A0A5B1CMT5_9BACT|nr:UTP--glucose-1-phosphate uridylyltransferase [Rubripirellula obstinata]KAA1261672.1 UTP--glucose-1-phosphate uridylyltransferase [Rubripirellula obstinata]